MSTEQEPRAADLLDQWFAHRDGRPLPPVPTETAPEAPVERAPEPVPEPTVAVAPEPVPEPVAEPVAERVAEVAPLVTAPVPAVPPRPITGYSSDGLAARLPESEQAEPEAVPSTVFFKPRTATRRILGFVLMAWLISAVFVVSWAVQNQSWINFDLAGVMVALTAITWAVRAGSSVAILTVHGGLLEIHHGSDTVAFDLASAHTAIQVEGRPGRRGWKVLFYRRNMVPFVVDDLMVEPREFMRVLRAYRPGL